MLCKKRGDTCWGSRRRGCSAASSVLAASHSRARRSIARITSCMHKHGAPGLGFVCNAIAVVSRCIAGSVEDSGGIDQDGRFLARLQLLSDTVL